jgi:hypothetical protein
MTRLKGVTSLPLRAGRVPVMLAGALLLGLLGCSHNKLSRAKAEDESEKDRYPIRTIADVTSVGNAEPVRLGGVGLVVGLEGTGGPSPKDSYRSMLEHELQQQGVHHVKEVLSSLDNALVIVEAQLPPGVRRGDPIDVEVKLPPGSRATSLRGGYLRKCYLYNYDFARNLLPGYTGPKGMMLGHKLVHAEGPILVGLTDGEESVQVKQGRIWGGGRSRIDQSFALVMNADQQFARVTSVVADRINETFHAGLRGVDDKLAVASNNLAVALRVPVQYRYNHPRYLRVVRMIPLLGGADAPLGEGPDRRSYRQRLTADLLDPGHTVVAALRLEALGTDSIPLFKKGLNSSYPLVRFCCAEGLAYLGSSSCADELARCARELPLLRAFALTALASLDEAVCHLKLRELLTTATDDETRYGAFRALRALDERNPLVRGELLNASFWLHRVPSEAAPLVHFSSTRRAEVVLYGEEPMLKPPFSFLAGEFTLTATEDDCRCSIRRIPLHGTPLRTQSSLAIADVLRGMAELGGQYPEVIQFLQQANSTRSLSCRVRCDALPQAVDVHELVQAGKGEADAAVLTNGQDLGVTPTLYELGLPSRSARIREREAMLRDQQAHPAEKPAQPE